MDSTFSLQPTPSLSLSLSLLSKTFTKLLRLRHSNSEQTSLHNNKLPDNISEPNTKQTETLAAKIFASISAVKAAYAQLQLAQTPYDPSAIQSADRHIVAELQLLSLLKTTFFNPSSEPKIVVQSELAAQVQEQTNLLKTYKITTNKLESELRSKDSELAHLQSELWVAEKRGRALEARLRPGRTLAALDELHLSGLNPTHFLTLLRFTVKSIRSFVKILTREMETAGWNLDAAAAAIQPDLIRPLNIKSRVFAFESYVAKLMFSDFENPGFGLGGGGLATRARFFAEFSEMKFMKAKECFDSGSSFGGFCRGRYLRLMHPKMEASFFGGGMGESEFFEVFAEMARGVWLLHCLFFSFEEEEKGGIFEVKKGSRFSEVFMESVGEEMIGGDCCPVVGFTVLPGFKVGKTVIQCRVFCLS